MSDFTTPEGRAELRKLFAHGSSRAIYSWAIVHGPALLDALDKSEGQAHEARVVARNTIAEADRNLIRAEAAEAALDRVRTLADDMETWYSPYNVALDCAKRIHEALDGAQ